MKICIIAHTEKTYLPYMDRYVEFFKENGVDYDIILWQREEKSLSHPENEYYFYEEIEDNFFKKIGSYIRFRRFVLKILKKNKYDKLVVLTTVPAVFLSGYLMNKYQNNYLFDLRDYSFERFVPYRKLVNKIIDNSALTTISSHGFMDFLAENKKIVMNHNIPLQFTQRAETVQDIKLPQVLNIGYVGAVRYYEESCLLMESLKNTFRYQLWFIGKEMSDCNLQGYCKEHGITNVSFVGKYNNSDKPELYKNIDIVNSVYGNESLEVTTLLPNRLYEACTLRKPILASKGTFLGELVDRYEIGLVFDAQEDNVLDMLEKYISEFKPEKFKKNCDEFLNDVQKDEDHLYRQLKLFIKQSKPKKKPKQAEPEQAEPAQAEPAQAEPVGDGVLDVPPPSTAPTEIPPVTPIIDTAEPERSEPVGDGVLDVPPPSTVPTEIPPVTPIIDTAEPEQAEPEQAEPDK